MNGRIAGLLFLAVCLTIAVLLLTRIVTPLIGGLVFAGALIVLGGSSRGFRK
jgi:hypothetical protein